ncbi:FAD binding domain-containing protein [Novosphingobium malaysiense]|uniref:Carbon monoxide dehydrogenase n=1 Tax=Novosphingobium malaysiense TaxID=1348853 RepID=A0A0B1ZM04_9SPHN|nr:xanthine dehydrogenase family protein subunit M [Novosphingobium malaysiense]KHK90320.1 carbon monoxide dehydrogenase [Novosphingobium malaysiense]
MKPAPFAYVAATSVQHAIEALAAAGGDGKIIAGGQSLMPMLNFRLVRPSVLVDINRIPGLDRIEDTGKMLRIGALVRHRLTASDPLIAHHVPVLHEAMNHVAHHTVRNRGTFCGSLCHADPAAEMPMMALLLDAVVEITGPAGTRHLPVREFLVASLTTDLAPDELVTAVEIAKPAPGTGWGFAEFARRHGDYALACVAALVESRDGAACNVRIAAMGIGDTALRLSAAEAALEGSGFSDEEITRAVSALRDEIEPMSDLSGSADYRRHLAGELARNVLGEAWRRAAPEVPA